MPKPFSDQPPSEGTRTSETVTVSLPLAALTGLQVVQAPPTLITQRNAEQQLGLSRGEYLELHREMRAHPTFGKAAIIRGKLRAVPREAFLEFLRAEPRAARSKAADAERVEDRDDATADELLREVGYETKPGHKTKGR